MTQRVLTAEERAETIAGLGEIIRQSCHGDWFQMIEIYNGVGHHPCQWCGQTICAGMWWWEFFCGPARGFIYCEECAEELFGYLPPEDASFPGE